MEFSNYTIKQFINELSSELPSPGGGSVAALVAALSGSLNSMVYSLTVGKNSFEIMDIDDKKRVLDFKEASTKFTSECLVLMEKDRDEFNKLMKTYKLPKETEEEKEYRTKAIKLATIKAMMAPLELCRKCYVFYDNIDVAVKYGNKMLLSDGACAASLLHSAIETSIINVKINLNSLRNGNGFIDIQKEIVDIEQNSLKRKTEILDNVNKIIYP